MRRKIYQELLQWKQRSGESRHRKNSVFHGCKIWKVIERWLFEVFRKRCRAFRALVARHTVFVDPPADGPSKPLLEQPEFGTLGKVIPQRRALEDRRTDPGQFQRHRLTLALGNSRVVGFEDQMDRIVGREEQPAE